MAVEHDDYVPTEDLILSKPRRHFRTTVHAIHWQLRSLIGVENSHFVYYVTGDLNKNIQRLNTATSEVETMKRLPFSPRCLVAENGWICSGGDDGNFAAIQLGEGNSWDGWQSTSDLLDLDQTADSDSTTPEDVIFLSLARARSNKSLLAESKKFGKELVNCITLWFPPTLIPPFEGAYSQPMAVLSNNDKTVTIIKLQSQEPEEVIAFPDCVNRAIISPDGRILIAITDDPYLYLHERVTKSANTHGPFRSADKTAYEWVSCGTIHLKSQKPDDPTTVRGSFAACFSGTGKYLAVGTQSASISIFNVAALTVPGVDPLLTSFTASRPSMEHGAVRDMAFSPGYGDLLAWTEDRGRVGVVDLRNGYVSRQIIDLDRFEDFEHISATDRSTIDPRLLEHRANNDTLSSSFANTLDLTTLEDRQRARDRDYIARYYSPLTSEETLVLEALQEHRRRQEQREQREQRAMSIAGAAAAASSTASPGTGSRSPWVERAERTERSTGTSTRTRDRSTSVTRTVNDIMGSIREQRERMRDQQERLRNIDNNSSAGVERRRAPMPPTAGIITRVINPTAPPPAEAERDMRIVSNGIYEPPTGRAAGRASLTTAEGYSTPPSFFSRDRRVNSGTVPSNNNATASNRDSPAPGPGPYTVELDLRRRDRAAYLMREWEENPTRRIENFFVRRGEPSPPDPHDTSGLGWSSDGNTLYVGADDGIYELHVNLLGRKLFSSVEVR